MFLNLLFFLSATLTILGAIMVLKTKNIMHSCIFLLASLIGIAGLYATLGADFVAVTQIMVYVGGALKDANVGLSITFQIVAILLLIATLGLNFVKIKSQE
jgi:hypothetical protein